MNLREYQLKCAETAVYPNIGANLMYPILGLGNEVGEFLGVVKKIMRDAGGLITEEWQQAAKKELGDVMWYTAQTATEAGVELEPIPLNGFNTSNAWSTLEEAALALYVAASDVAVTKLMVSNRLVPPAEPTYKLYPIMAAVAVCASYIGYTLQEVCAANVEKLADRQSRGVLKGSGDNR